MLGMHVSINEAYPTSGAQNTVDSLLDGCFETGVCARGPGWILLTCANSIDIYGIRVSGFHGKNSAWSPSNGAGAEVQYSSDGLTFTTCGLIPIDFGKGRQLYDVPLSAPVTAQF